MEGQPDTAQPGAGSKTKGFLLLFVGVVLALSALIAIATGFVYTLEGDVVLIAAMLIGVVLACVGFFIIINPNLPPAAPPSPYNEYQIVCEKCERVIPEGVSKCPHCGNPIDWEER